MSSNAPIPNLDAFHKQRGKLVDCFAVVESRLVQAIHRAGGKLKGDTFSGKIKTLRELGTKSAAATFENDLNQLLELNLLRTEIVHGTISIYDDGDERYAVFSNARHAAKQVQPVTRLTHRGMRDVSEQLAGIAERVRHY